MKRFFVSLMLVASIAFGAGGVVMAASPTDAAKFEACSGLGATTGSTCGDPNNAAATNRVVSLAIEVLGWVAGIAAVIMIIVSGLKYITSGGDASAVSSAKNSLIYALIGVVIVALAQFIVHFVLGRV